jgi:hypothetical protein
MPAETMTKTDDPQRERLVYTYTYTTDGENGQNPQSNTVKVTTTVEEETTPDGTKVVRKKEESQQVSKVTKIEKITRVHRHLIDPLTGELLPDDPRYPSTIKHETSGGFLPNSSSSSTTKHTIDRHSYDNETKALTNGMRHFSINDEDNRRIRLMNGNGYNEPENNKSIF